MKNKKRKPKKVRKAKNKEFKSICDIINKALKRIILRKTKLTYQQELHLISKTIQKFVEISYVPKVYHTKIIVEQVFNIINILEDKKDLLKKEKGNLDIIEGLEIAIKKVKN